MNTTDENQNQMKGLPGSDLSSTLPLPGFDEAVKKLVKPFRFSSTPHEYKVVSLRECPLPEAMAQCDTPEGAAKYWRATVQDNPYFDPERECFVLLFLNTRRRIKGHQLLSIGTADTILVHPREVFRLACITSASALVLMHNHPSGEATPSEADIKVTRDLIRAGQLLKIEVLDHVVMGRGAPGYASLREMGYFYS
jgi:DNA repair protein RadC